MYWVLVEEKVRQRTGDCTTEHSLLGPYPDLAYAEGVSLARSHDVTPPLRRHVCWSQVLTQREADEWRRRHPEVK